MKAERAPFAPLLADIDDDRIEKLAREKGVGTYTAPRPQIEQHTSLERIVVQTEVDTPTLHNRPQEEEGSLAPQATPRSRMKKVNLELPDYVWTELKIRAVERQTSLRHVVMASLVADGVTIIEEDMIEDGRRLR